MSIVSLREKFQQAGVSLGMNMILVGTLFDEATKLVKAGLIALEEQEWQGIGMLIGEYKEETQRNIGGLPRVIPEKIEPKFKFDNQLKKSLAEEAANLPAFAKSPPVEGETTVPPVKAKPGEKPGPEGRIPPPPPPPPLPPPPATNVWHYAVDGDSYGPMTVEMMVGEDNFDLNRCQVFNETWSAKTWQRASDVAAVVTAFEKQKDSKLPPIPMS